MDAEATRAPRPRTRRRRRAHAEDAAPEEAEAVEQDLDELRAKAARARRVPRARPAHAGGLRELPQADGPRGRRGRGPRREPAWPRSCCPRSTTSSARSHAAERTPARRARLTEGIRLVQAELHAALGAPRASRPTRPKGEPFDPTQHEAMAQQPVEGAESGTVVEVYQPGYRLNGDRPAARPGRRGGVGAEWPSSATPTRCSASTGRRRPTRSRRPTASSPASTTRTATRTTRRPRSASRRSSRPTTCCRDPDKRKQYDRGGFDPFAAGGGAGGGGSAASTPGGSRRHPLRPVRPRPAARARGGGRGAAAAAAERGRDLETEVSISLRAGGRGRAGPARRSRPSQRCPTCRGTGAKPGTSAEGLPALPGPRRRVAGPGPVLDLPAVLALRRQRHGHRGPVPDLPRLGRDADGQALQGQHPRRRARGQPHPPRRQGRGRARSGGPAGDLFVVTHVAESPVFERKGDNLEVEVPLTIPEALRGAEIEVPTLNGRKTLRVPPGHEARHGPAPARRGPAAGSTASGRGDIHYRFVIDVPDQLTPRAGEGGRASSREVMNGNPRTSLFA